MRILAAVQGCWEVSLLPVPGHALTNPQGGSIPEGSAGLCGQGTARDTGKPVPERRGGGPFAPSPYCW